jgi:hypothetical protein
MAVDPNAAFSTITVKLKVASELLASHVGRCIPMKEVTKAEKKILAKECLEWADVLIEQFNKEAS